MSSSKIKIRLCLIVFAAMAGISLWVSPVRSQERFEVESYLDIKTLFQRENYTRESWRGGNREVPRIYFTHMPERWGKKTNKEMNVLWKKLLFFRLVLPLVLRSNELIAADRERLLKIIDGGTPSPEDRAWLSQLALGYRVSKNPVEQPSREQIDELERRVDIVPPSLALAQTAEESGWGTSRFADLGNALFGQWTWGGKGIEPLQKRSGKGNYKVAAFDSPQESVHGYMRNLNTTKAYELFRGKRAELRQQDEKIDGLVLSDTMIKYSERGQAYVKTLKIIIRKNNLEAADDTHLSEGPVILLVPVGAGSQ